MEESKSTKSKNESHLIAAVEIMKSGYMYQKEVQTVLKPFDISHEQFNVMRILAGAKENHLSLKAVQARIMNQTANTTRLVEKLKLKKLVKSEYSPTNRRRLEITLTSKGHDLLKRIKTPLYELGDRVAQVLNQEDSETLIRILRKFQSF